MMQLREFEQDKREDSGKYTSCCFVPVSRKTVTHGFTQS